MVELQTSEMVN